MRHFFVIFLASSPNRWKDIQDLQKDQMVGLSGILR